MKHLFRFIVFLFATCLIFTSCKTASITKRHYNKGYYVSHSHKKHKTAVHENEKEKSPALVKAKPETQPETTSSTATPSSENKEAVAAHTSGSDDFEFATPVKAKKSLFKRNLSAPSGEEFEFRDAIKNPLKFSKSATKATEDDALSLLWILIVALLIIYIVGILLDGFGLGGIIHILGVVVLVLLILWLLKVI